MEDKRIIELYLKRDEEALLHTSEKYGKRITLIAKNILQNDEDAKECENDTYLTLWNRIPPNEPWDYLYAFIAKITRNISLDVCRKKKSVKRNAKLVELTEEMEQCIPSKNSVLEEMEEKMLAKEIGHFLLRIKEEQRDMFLRRYFYMDSVKEIADLFHVSESKVKTTLHRVRIHLKDYLSNQGFEN